MEIEEWKSKVVEHQTKLRQFLLDWHPIELAKQKRRIHTGKITAPTAEEACAVVRESVATKEVGKDVLTEFDNALRDGDMQTVYSLLNSAWFGVPESTSCWDIEGFKEAVDLLEDPPEPDEELQEATGMVDIGDIEFD